MHVSALGEYISTVAVHRMHGIKWYGTIFVELDTRWCSIIFPLIWISYIYKERERETENTLNDVFRCWRVHLCRCLWARATKYNKSRSKSLFSVRCTNEALVVILHFHSTYMLVDPIKSLLKYQPIMVFTTKINYILWLSHGFIKIW